MSVSLAILILYIAALFAISWYAKKRSEGEAENYALAYARGKLDEVEGGDRAVGVLLVGYVEHSHAYGEPAHHAYDVREYREQRKHENKREYARKHEKFHRGYSESPERGDFLVHFHRAKLRRESRPRAAAHHNSDHYRAHFPHHSNSDQVRHKYLRAVFGKLYGSDKRQNKPYKKTY